MDERETKERVFLEAIFGEERRACQMDLRGADLRNLRAAATRLSNCVFTGAQMSGSDWWGATIRACQLDDGNAQASCFVEARFEDSSAEGANFRQADFRRAHLSETSFARAILREANLEESRGAGIVLRGADMRGANLRQVDWEAADFRGADLRGADLSRGRFLAADFRGAVFEWSQFEGADTTDATFDHERHSQMEKQAEPVNQGAPADPEVAKILNDFLTFLPEAVSGAEPADLAKRLQDLVSRLTESAGYSEEQGRLVREYLADLTRNGKLDLRRLQELVDSLAIDSDGPPAELRSWLEPLMRGANKE